MQSAAASRPPAPLATDLNASPGQSTIIPGRLFPYACHVSGRSFHPYIIASDYLSCISDVAHAESILFLKHYLGARQIPLLVKEPFGQGNGEGSAESNVQSKKAVLSEQQSNGDTSCLS